MINVALTDVQFSYFIAATGFQSKAQLFLRHVYVDSRSIKEASKSVGFTTVRGYQVSSQFEAEIDKVLASKGASLTLKIEGIDDNSLTYFS